jgi:putative heme-binding domain-containing protein
MAGALAKSDTGCDALLKLVAAGKVSSRVLINKGVSGPIATRPKEFRDRTAFLTKDLPPEDARLDGVIADRARAFAAAKADPAHGAQVFQQNCAVCHRFRSQGGNVGPNLDGVVARGPARLIEDILDPNRNVDPLFRQTTFETTEGDTLIGANVRDQGMTILFADPTGKDVTIQKSHIKKQITSNLSLMPPVFETTIQPPDFYDLLSYLLNPAQQQ